MGVMYVENSFPYEGRLIGKQHLSREKENCSTLSEVPLWKMKYEVHNHPVIVPGHTALETDGCRVLRESSRRWNGKP